MSTPSARHTAPAHVPPRSTPAARRLGYLIAVVVNGVLLYLINRDPGWQAVPFLTDATTEVLGLVNASIVVSLVANLVYVAWDPVWLKALGDLVTISVSVVALVRIWQVWPIDFPAGSPWEVLARVAVGVGIAGGLVGIVASIGRFTKTMAVQSRRDF
jgi:hypothetical protein